MALNLTGRVVGKLTVLGQTSDYVSPKGVRATRWYCICECGARRVVIGTNLSTGRTKSCGCLRIQKITRKLADLTGQRFGKLLVIDRAEYGVTNRPSMTRWNCICDCGISKTIQSNHLRAGETASCGCTRHPTKHGLLASGQDRDLYYTWRSIIRRCTYPSDPGFRNYGARGIEVHQDWLYDPRPFKGWIEANLGPRPIGCQLDRIDNDGNYEPGNLRWATIKENANNRRTIAGLEARVKELKQQLERVTR